MKAIVVSDRGSKENLTVKDVEDPKEPQDNEVRVKYEKIQYAKCLWT